MDTRNYFHPQSGLIHPDEAGKYSVILIGCGGLGSYIAPLISKLGVRKLILIDYDTVEAENIAGQNFLPQDIAELKVDALARKCLYQPRTKSVKILGASDINYLFEPNQIVIPAVDNMATRLLVYQTIANTKESRPKWIIDPRMGGEIGKIETCYTWDSASRGRYSSSLHSDADSMPLPCAERITGYNASMIASLVVALTKHVITDTKWQNIPTRIYSNLPRQSIDIASDFK